MLFTDFGTAGPYTGQVQAAVAREVPGVPIIRLVSDAPMFSPEASAHLLASLVDQEPMGSVFLCVVDPGVGTGRDALVVGVDGKWLVGPDNGLLDVCMAQAKEVHVYRIDWRPARLSATFHGRDLFAPIAARIARDGRPSARDVCLVERVVPRLRDLWEVIYVDHYGNAMTGIRASALEGQVRIFAGTGEFMSARTFADVDVGKGLWYENSNKLVELAVNQGSAAATFRLQVGEAVSVR